MDGVDKAVRLLTEKLLHSGIVLDYWQEGRPHLGSDVFAPELTVSRSNKKIKINIKYFKNF